MRTIVPTALLTLFGTGVHAQNFLAGDPLTLYVDVVPDTIISQQCPPEIITETYNVNMDGDMVDDFVVKSQCDFSNFSRIVSISPLHEQSFAQFVWSDSVFVAQTESWQKAPMAVALAQDALINDVSANWRSQQLFLTYDYFGPNYNLYVPGWANSTDRYIGIRLGQGGTYRYGWIRMNCPSMTECMLKDHALGDEIFEGQTRVEPLDGLSTTVHVDNISDVAIIRMNSDRKRTLDAHVYDMVGHRIGLAATGIQVDGASQHMLDISSLNTGLYFITFIKGTQLFGTARFMKMK